MRETQRGIDRQRVGTTVQSVRASSRRRGSALQPSLTFLVSVFGRQFSRPGPFGDVIPTATAAGTVHRARRGLVRCPRHPPAVAAGACEGERKAAECRGIGRPYRGSEAVPARSSGEGK